MNIMKIVAIIGSITLARILLFLISMTLITGSFFYHIKSEVFVALNTVSLFDWLQTYGQSNLLYTWWFYLFIILMFMLGANTLFCTVDRTYLILSRYKKIKGESSVLLPLSPHIMHLSFIVLLLGYFLLYTFGINSYNNILTPTCPVKVHGEDLKINMLKFNAEPYNSRLYEGLKGKFISPEFDITLESECNVSRRTLGLNSPVYFKGYSIHVENFSPKSKRSMSRETWVNLTIRKNAGIPVFIMGIVFFMFGTFLYVIYVIKNSNSREGKNENI